jgi:hypothetical protein
MGADRPCVRTDAVIYPRDNFPQTLQPLEVIDAQGASVCVHPCDNPSGGARNDVRHKLEFDKYGW